jgi:putative nucleotidyltransferase with HDIG domain
MPARLGFLRTRVGRRFLTGNLLSAFLPLVAITALSIGYLRAELRREAESRVTRLSKALTLSTLSALTDVRRELRNQPSNDALVEKLSSTFLDARAGDASSGVPLSVADPAPRRALTDDELARLRSGQVILHVSPRDGAGDVLLARAILPWRAEERPVVWARVNPAPLWDGADETIGGEDADYCVYETESNVVIHCTAGVSAPVERIARAAALEGGTGRVAGEADGHFVSTRDVYLRHELGASEWRVVILQPVSRALDPLRSFVRISLLLTVAMAILIFLVSHTQIRRTTEPLARLQEGTRRLQRGDFSEPVVVTSRDEYAEVAESFNGMAHTLDRQLVLLRNLDAVDQAALTAGGARDVVDEAMGRFCSSLACSRVTIAVAASTPGMLDLTTIDPLAPVSRRLQRPLLDEERAELLAHPRQLFLVGDAAARSYLPSSTTVRAEEGVLVLPLVHDAELLGLIALGCHDTSRDHTADCDEARRLADRVALALSHVQLVGQLHALSVGTLTAFARAIDANSPWTAGHSERVTRVAMTIGRELQLSDDELRTLERGGLLHDIGKIAVPAAILDKNDKLDAAEWRVMQQHPVVGYEILTPIPAFASALPIVRSHHERMDGTGYPDGLRGDQIPWLARVLAVADVFDALVSDRPYRRGLPIAEASRIITSSAGSHLDPRVVLAFQDAMRQGRIRAEEVSHESSSLAAEVARARDAHSLVA